MSKMFQDEFVVSPFFGKSLKLTGAGEDVLKRLITSSPLAVFQTLNKTLNERNICIKILVPSTGDKDDRQNK